MSNVKIFNMRTVYKILNINCFDYHKLKTYFWAQ